MKSRRPFLDDQRGDAFFAFRRIGVHVDDGRVGHAAIGDPGLCAVEDVSVALLHGYGLQRGGVGAGLRLGERVAADFFSPREGRAGIFSFVRQSKAMNRIAVKRILYREDHAGGSAAARDFFDHDRVSDVVETRAAFGFGEALRR